MKPIDGFNSEGVVQFKVLKDFLYYRFLGNQLAKFKKIDFSNKNANISYVFSFWSKLTKIYSRSFVMPYLTCENTFFESHYNLDLRIITRRNFSSSQISLKNCILPIYIF